MKRLFSIIFCLLALTSCTKNEIPVGKGTIAITPTQGANVFAKDATKESGSLSPIPDTYTVTLTNSATQEIIKTGTYGQMKEAFEVNAGTYHAYAQNCTAEEAENANSNRGQQRFYGSTSAPVIVNPGEKTIISFVCSMTNSKVTFVFDNSFKTVFDIENTTSPTSIAATANSNSGRTVAYTKDATLETEAAFFNVTPELNTLNYVITTARKDGTPRTYNLSLTLEPKSWHKITIKAATTSGQGDFDITIDNNITTLSSDISVNPY